MTTPAQLSNRPAARGSEVGSAGARPLRGASPIRPLPAPPAPVLPLAPPVRENVVPRTRRQPNGVVYLAAAAVTLAVVGGVSWIGQSSDPGVPARTVLTRVGAGETVWDVAQRVAPKSDRRAVVQRIRQLNEMAGSAVVPGQQLQVPDGR